LAQSREKRTKEGGGKAPAQEKVKLAKYGFRFAKTFKRFLDDDLWRRLPPARAAIGGGG
jgi:hypothetical protein